MVSLIARYRARVPKHSNRVVWISSCGSNHLGHRTQEWLTADVQLPVRAMANPFKVNELRDLSGLDDSVQHYIRTQPEWALLRENALTEIHDALAEQAVVMVAVLCSGGHDRSVGTAELLGAELRTWPDLKVHVEHLHLYRRHPHVPATGRVGRPG